MSIPKFESTTLQLYLDVDGVFADFDKRVKQLTGKFPNEITSSQLWKSIYRDESFFLSLELKDEAQYLWEYAKQYKPKFLTGAPSSHKARDQKRQWILEKEHSLPDGSTFTFGKEFEVIVLPRKDKQLYASSNAVLLDDREDNIKQWKDAGGIGVLHFDVFFSIGQLESIRERHDR